MLKVLKGARVLADCKTGELHIDTGDGSCKPLGGGITTVKMTIKRKAQDSESYDILSASHSAVEVCELAKIGTQIMFVIEKYDYLTESETYHDYTENLMAYRYYSQEGFYSEHARVDLDSIYGRIIFDAEYKETYVEVGME